MIEFMIIGAPRSGTAWAANWLTTERTLCFHDMLFTHDIEDLDALPCDRIRGLADTGLALFPRWLEAHPAKKIILRRDPKQIRASLRRVGLDEGTREWTLELRDIRGLHIDWQVLFTEPELIHHYLFGDEIPFDKARHEVLAKLNVQADFEKIDPDPVVTRRLLERMRMDQR